MGLEFYVNFPACRVSNRNLCPEGLEDYQMNARMKAVIRFNGGLLVISPDKACGGLQKGRWWTRFQRTLERIRLLLGSPVASFRWARAKRRVESRKKGMSTPESKGHHSSSLSDCVMDGVIPGY
jgi:hypothetical protein